MGVKNTVLKIFLKFIHKCLIIDVIFKFIFNFNQKVGEVLFLLNNSFINGIS